MEEKGDSRVPPPRVRIFECARDGIQELFNRDSSKATKPMDERNFPKSFWIPPTKEHSNRTGSSTDNNIDGYCISHRKSNSSPSCIGTNPAYLSEVIDHNRQKSLDTTQNLARNPGTGLSPHVNRGPFHYSETLPTDSLTSPICELPPEFQMAINEKKQVYFLNHETKQTTWYDPRIPPEEQKWGMTIEELDQIHANYARRHKGHRRQIPASPMSVLSPVDSGGLADPNSCCSALPGSPINATPGQMMSTGGGNAGTVRPSSVPRMQHPGGFSMPHGAPNSRAHPLNLLRPQGSKQMPPRQHPQHHHISHAKSASQPAPMTVSCVSGHGDPCMGARGPGGSSDYALGPSSSLTRLHQPSYGAAGVYPPENPPLPASSSGHLAQDMEELSLSRGESQLPHLQQMFCDTTPLLPLLSQPPNPSNPGGGEYGSAVPSQQISSAQHSHQSSMDSGVGPSVAGGHSIPSANQTPEHTKVACFDSNMDNCEMGPDFLSYSADWGQSLDYCLSDRIPPHRLGPVSGMAEMTRSQQS
nr:hypothetical transcript [Hymenolepis microstoma]